MHGAGVARALIRVAGCGPEHQLVELGWNARVLTARGRNGVVRVLLGNLEGLLARERLLAGEHLVEHNAERVDVTAGIRHTTRDEFGGEVCDRAEQCIAGCGIRVGRPGQPEVADLNSAVIGKQHIFRLQVAVDNAVLVRCGEAGKDRLHDVHRLHRGEHLVLLEQVAQGDSWQVLHYQVCRFAILSLVVNIHDVRMCQPGSRPGFLDEAGLVLVIVGEVTVHDLERNAAFEAQVGGQIYGGHTAARDA